MMSRFGFLKLPLLLVLILTAGACSASSPKPQVQDKKASFPSFVSPRKVTPIAVPDAAAQPNYAITAFGSVWITHDEGYVSRIDPRQNKVAARVRVPSTPGPLSAAAGSVWVCTSEGGISRIDIHTNRVTDGVHTPVPLTGLASGFGRLWATSSVNDALYEVDTHARKIIRTTAVFDASSVATGFGSVWVAGGSGSNVVQVEPKNGKVVRKIKIPRGVHTIAAIGDSVWVSSGPNGDAVSRIDPASGKVRAIDLEQASFPDGMAGTDDVVWVGEYQGNRVDAIDPHTGRVIDRVRVGTGPAIVTQGFGSLWVANYEGSSVWRLPLRPQT
jgi:streptogramin lyase